MIHHDSKRYASSAALADPEPEAERTTVSPPFDVEAFARETTRRSLSPSNLELAVLGIVGTRSAGHAHPRSDELADMRERFARGDYAGSLEIAERALFSHPGNREAAECAGQCRTMLEDTFTSRLGSLEAIPVVALPRTALKGLSIDHRAGFILSLLDGSSSIDVLLDLCGMARLDALRILHELVQARIVTVR